MEELYVTTKRKRQSTRGEFLTVITNMSSYNCLTNLKSHFDVKEVHYIIYSHQEVGKIDADGGNLFFDRGKCSATNQLQSKKWYGLAAPGDQTVDKSFMYTYMKSAMPLRGQDLQHLLYL
eukprot:15336634-Ditylum_brightwellii.AAC.1